MSDGVAGLYCSDVLYRSILLLAQTNAFGRSLTPCMNTTCGNNTKMFVSDHALCTREGNGFSHICNPIHGAVPIP